MVVNTLYIYGNAWHINYKIRHVEGGCFFNMNEVLVISKLIVTVIAVVSLSIIAERISPKAAGILSGYPLGSAISLFFFGIEIGPQFASESATYTMVGLIGTQVFVYFYYKASCYFMKHPILMTSIIALCCYFIAAFLLHFIQTTKIEAILLTILSICLFMYLFKGIPITRINNQIKLRPQVILFRGGMAAISILIITGIAKSIGSVWAGLLSAFPVTVFPLLLIVHMTYDKHHVHTIIKYFPIGLGSIISYATAVSYAYPAFGVYMGTIVSFIAATIYLFIYQASRAYMKKYWI